MRWSVLVLMMAASTTLAAPSRRDDVSGSGVGLVFESSPLANLVYQLECIARVHEDCAAEAFAQLWRSELAWTDADERELERLGFAARSLAEKVAATSTHTWSSLADAEARDFLTRYHELSSVVLVTPAHAAALRDWAELIGTENCRRIEAAARQHPGFVYGVRRSAKASVFVLIADAPHMDALVERLIAAPKVIEGLGPTLPR
jgi:hypothetical protein